MKIEVMGHHRCPDDANGNVEALRIQTRQEPAQDSVPIRLGQKNLENKANADHRDQTEVEGPPLADAKALDGKQQESIERGEEHAPLHWNAKKQIEANRGAQHLSQVTGGNGNFE